MHIDGWLRVINYGLFDNEINTRIIHYLVAWSLISAVTFIYGMVQLIRKDLRASSTLNIGFGVGNYGVILIVILVGVVT